MVGGSTSHEGRLDRVGVGQLPAPVSLSRSACRASSLAREPPVSAVSSPASEEYVVASPANVGAENTASDVLGSARNVGVLPGAGTSPKTLVGFKPKGNKS